MINFLFVLPLLDVVLILRLLSTLPNTFIRETSVLVEKRKGESENSRIIVTGASNEVKICLLNIPLSPTEEINKNSLINYSV